MSNSGDTIYLIHDDSDLEEVPQMAYDNEDLLQALIEKFPQILAGGQIGADEPIRWMLVKREAGIPDGQDHNDR